MLTPRSRYVILHSYIASVLEVEATICSIMFNMLELHLWEGSIIRQLTHKHVYGPQSSCQTQYVLRFPSKSGVSYQRHPAIRRTTLTPKSALFGLVGSTIDRCNVSS